MFDTEFAICKDRHLHIQKLNVEISDEENFTNGMSILVTTQKAKGISEKEERVLPKKKVLLGKDSSSHKIAGSEIQIKKVMA